MTLIDDAGDLARHALALHLEAMLGPTVIIGDSFQRIDQDDVEASGTLCRWCIASRNSRACDP